ncbi:hypothetical protein D3C72_1160430 [compost metagenome]
MASKVSCATSAAVTFPECTALSDNACDTSCERVGGASLASPAGRLRCDWLMPVGTKYGHSTEQCTCSVTRLRSW